MSQAGLLQLIAAIVIALCLLLITLRFTFNAGFRNDVIAGEGESKILGVLSVKGTLILVLILGLVGSLIFLSTGINSTHTANSKVRIEPPSNQWYALNESGTIIQPTIYLSDSSGSLGIDPLVSAEVLFDGNKLSLMSVDRKIQVQKDGKVWGTLDNDGLDSLFFNSFQTFDSEELPDKDFSYRKFTYSDNSWTPGSYNFFNAFRIEVQNALNLGTVYLIRNSKTGEIVFNSRNNGQVINAGEDNSGKSNRIFHIFQHGKDYFLFRILFADINSEDVDPYITFIGIKLRPELDIK